MGKRSAGGVVDGWTGWRYGVDHRDCGCVCSRSWSRVLVLQLSGCLGWARLVRMVVDNLDIMCIYKTLRM